VLFHNAITVTKPLDTDHAIFALYLVDLRIAFKKPKRLESGRVGGA
jgi:hypothetical protein